MSHTSNNIGSFQPGSRAVIRTKTVYNANGWVVALIDDRGAQTTFQYDLLDRQTSMSFQDGSTRTSVYDLADDVTGYTDENGSVFANTFDSLGRRTATAITRATGVIGTTAQSFQYDGLSRLTFARDTVGTTNVDVNFYYDSLSRVVEESQTLGGNTCYVTHSAFTSYVVTELTYPNGRKVTYGYDALYRRNTINETSGGASIAAWQFFGYRTAKVALGNGITCSFMNNDGNRSAIQAGQPTPPWGDVTTDRLGYDGSGRLIAKRFLSISDTPNTIAFTTEYDPAGNKLFERALHAESRSALYPSYDSINRLLEYQRGVLASGGESVATPITLPNTDSDRTYDLDHLGNWKNTVYTPEGGTPTTEVRRHNLMNEVTRFGTTPVLYDHGNNIASPDPLIAARGNGNIADDGTFTYQYDALNRLTTVKSGSTTVNDYTYDALGRFVATPEFRSLWEGQQIVEVQTIANVTAHQHVWGQYIDELVQLKAYGDSAATDYVLQDPLYRSIAMTSSSATIVEAYDYDAYGNTLLYNAGSGGAWFTDSDHPVSGTNNPYLFTGRQYDNTVKIYYYRARFYHPGLGRFLSRDRIGYVAGMSLYQYAGGNSLGFVDPTGTDGFGPPRFPGTPNPRMGAYKPEPEPMSPSDAFLVFIDDEISPWFLDDPSTLGAMVPAIGPFRKATFNLNSGHPIYGSIWVVMSALDVCTLGKASKGRAAVMKIGVAFSKDGTLLHVVWDVGGEVRHFVRREGIVAGTSGFGNLRGASTVIRELHAPILDSAEALAIRAGAKAYNCLTAAGYAWYRAGGPLVLWAAGRAATAGAAAIAPPIPPPAPDPWWFSALLLVSRLSVPPG